MRSKEDQGQERRKTIHGSPIATREVFAGVTASIKGVSAHNRTQINDTARFHVSNGFAVSAINSSSSSAVTSTYTCRVVCRFACRNCLRASSTFLVVRARLRHKWLGRVGTRAEMRKTRQCPAGALDGPNERKHHQSRRS